MAKPPPQQKLRRNESAYGPLRTQYKGYEARHCQPEPPHSEAQEAVTGPAIAGAEGAPPTPASPAVSVSSRGTAVVTYAADGELVVSHAVRHNSLEGAAATLLSQPSDHPTLLLPKGLLSRRPSVGSTELPEEQEPEGEVVHPTDLEDAYGSSSPTWKSGSESLAPSLVQSVAASERLVPSVADLRRLSGCLSGDAGARREVGEHQASPPRSLRPMRSLAQPPSGGASPITGLLRQGSRVALSPTSSTANSWSNQLSAVGRRVSLQKPVFDSDEDAM